MARAADVDLHIVNFTTTENGRINISFYVTLSRETLLADSLEALLNKASTSNTTLTQNGISVVEVHRPRGVIATPEQMSGSSSSHVFIFGTSLAALGVVILIGALGCVITAGYAVPSLYNTQLTLGYNMLLIILTHEIQLALAYTGTGLQ